MATITEDYVSFETAKLLKEKGFDSNEVGCHGGFYSERCYEFGHGIKTQSGQEVGIVSDDLTNSELEHDEYLRPTLQMAMKWLRKVHKIHIAIYPYGEYYCDNYQFDVYRNNNFVVSKDEGYITYEEACESAIKYCLENLIK